MARRLPRISRGGRGGTAYVPDEGSGTISVVDTASASVVGERFYVSDHAQNIVQLIDAKTRGIVARIPTRGKNPEHAVFSPDARWTYVSAEDATQVDVVDVAERRQVAAIDVGRRPRGIAFTPDGSRAYVACEPDSTVSVIDTAANAGIGDIAVGKLPWGVAIR